MDNPLFLETVEFYHFRINSANFLIFRRIVNQTVSGPIDFHSRKKYIIWKSMGPETVWLLIFF